MLKMLSDLITAAWVSISAVIYDCRRWLLLPLTIPKLWYMYFFYFLKTKFPLFNFIFFEFPHIIFLFSHLQSASSASRLSCSPTRPARRCWDGWSLQVIPMDTSPMPVLTGAGVPLKVTRCPSGSFTWTWRTAPAVTTTEWRSGAKIY